jgi:ABC-type multidrug transport system fused ATPase/permease subunit
MLKIRETKSLKIILRIISRRRKIQLIILSFITFFSSLLEVFSLGAIFPFISVFIDPSTIFNNLYIKPLLVYFEISEPDEIYFPVTLGFFILTTISYAVKTLLIYLRVRLSRIISHEISVLIYWKIINESYQFHTNQNSGDIIFGLTYSLNISTSYFIPILKIINSTLILLFALIGASLLNPLIAISILGCLFVFYFTIGISINNSLKTISLIQSENYSNFLKLIQESLGAIKMIILKKAQPFYLKSYSKLTTDYLMSLTKTEYISQLPKIFLEYSIIILVIASTFIFKGKENIIVLGPIIITLLLAFQKFLPEANILYDSITKLKSKKEIVNRVISYLNINQKSPYRKEVKMHPIDFRTKVQFKNLNFSYETDENKILSNFNLTIDKGKSYGIVGKTGSGKSTLIDIISGLITPNSGQIFVDNLLIDATNIQGWKQKINLVSQNIFLFDSTIEENIALNSNYKIINYEKLDEVCRIVQLTEFIKNQPKGYQSKVGEKGIKISGGQMQRIGIARALYNPSEILILDEATSALDSLTERKVMKNIIDYTKNLTLIIIAHRITTLKNCDVIFKINPNGLERYSSYNKFINNNNYE